MEEVLVPYLLENHQEKWSAARCRQIVEKIEAAGFTVSEESKDEIYRTKREHRLSESEAMLLIVESQYGEYWDWTARDWAWWEDVVHKIIGKDDNDGYCWPPEDDGTLASEVAAMARDALRAEDNSLTEAQLDALDMSVYYGDSNDWCVMLFKEWFKEEIGVFRYYPQTGEQELYLIK